MPPSEAPFIRFLRKISHDPVSGCWNWTGDTGSTGYGCLKVFGKMKAAHRFSHELYLGPIPPDLEILHSCDNKLCVNPDHLSAGPHQQNMYDAWDRGLIPSGPNLGKTGVGGIRRWQSKPVFVLGKAYGSQNEAERALSLGSGTVKFWINRNQGKARLISREEYDDYVKQGLDYREPRSRPRNQAA